VFRECDSEALWALATAAADAEHGTMLVISERAAKEAARLESQALTVEPTRLDDSLVRQATGIDGAVLVDPSGCCHAIGVILDGTVTGAGDRSRGARYNSAVKYLSSAEDTPTVILLVSEDGMINLLPDLRPRMRRADLEAMLAELREAAAFYLSPGQIEEVNALRDDHSERRMAEGANIRVIEAPLRPDPEMTDEYLID
jgi:DisA bacterial checkpoint controller nucleotide-binding